MTKTTRRYKHTNRFEYTEEMIEWLKINRSLMRPKEFVGAFNDRFEQNKCYKTLQHACNIRKIFSGKTGKFTKGCKPHNYGSSGTGLMKSNSGSFKKGNVPTTIRPIGTERVNVKDGYLMIKTANPRTWKLKHVWIYEQNFGPLKQSHVVRFIDGDKTNLDITNLESVNKSEIVIYNKNYSQAHEQIKPACRALVKLYVKTKELQKEQ